MSGMMKCSMLMVGFGPTFTNTHTSTNQIGMRNGWELKISGNGIPVQETTF